MDIKFFKKKSEKDDVINYKPVSKNDIVEKRNEFSASAENFINTQPKFILYGPIFIIFLLLFVALVYSFFATVETKVTTLIAVDGENYLAQSPVSGSVAAILVSENEDIRTGDQLMTVLSESTLINEESINEIKNELGETERMFYHVDFTIARILKLTDYYESLDEKFKITISDIGNNSLPDETGAKKNMYFLSWDQSEYFATLSKVESQLKNVWESYKRTSELLKIQKKEYAEDKELYKENAITESEFNASFQTLSNLESSMESLISSYKIEVYSVVEQLLDQKANILVNHKNYLTQLNQAKTLEDEVIMDGKVAMIKSKYPGVIAEQYVKNFQYVSEGMVLMKIIRSDLPKTGKVYITNQNVGKVKPGQNVFIKFDAFPYQQYGAQMGKITSVSADVKMIEGMGFAYVADVAFEKINPKISVKYGMRGTAEIQTGEKKLIELIFGPMTKVFDYLRGKN